MLLSDMDSQGLGELIFHLPADTKKRVRYLEKCYFNICKQKSSMLFNETCIKGKRGPNT